MTPRAPPLRGERGTTRPVRLALAAARRSMSGVSSSSRTGGGGLTTTHRGEPATLNKPNPSSNLGIWLA